MNWEAAGAIGEIVGAIAVVVTLAYLATQTRLNMRATKAVAYEDIYRDLQQNLNSLDASLFERALKGGQDFTELEMFTLNRWRAIMFRMYENWWKQHKNGILDDDVYAAYNSHMRNTLSIEGSINWWRNLRRPEYIPGFVEYVEKWIAIWELK